MSAPVSHQFTLYTQTTPSVDTPIVIVPTFGDEGEKLCQAMREISSPACVLAVVSIEHWEETLSPWPAKRVFKDASDFGCGADDFIDELVEKTIPEIKKQSGLENAPCYIAGYSLAGMFALYSLYRTDIFTRAASVSGSLWFPGFMEFAETNQMKKQPQRIYLSLGDRESQTRNETMRTVAEKTESLHRYFQRQNINCNYELNPGNHFQHPESRLARGISWLLQE